MTAPTTPQPDSELTPGPVTNLGGTVTRKPTKPLAPELRYKEQFKQGLGGTLTHYGDEATVGMLAETASQIACDLIQAAHSAGYEAGQRDELAVMIRLMRGPGSFTDQLSAAERRLRALAHPSTEGEEANHE